MHKNAHRSFIFNVPMLEISQMFRYIKWKKNLYSYNVILFSNVNEYTTPICKTCMNLICIMSSSKSQTQKSTYSKISFKYISRNRKGKPVINGDRCHYNNYLRVSDN